MKNSKRVISKTQKDMQKEIIPVPKIREREEMATR